MSKFSSVKKIIDTNPKIAHIKIKGHLDAETFTAFQKEMDKLTKIYNSIICSCKELEYIASPGLGVLLASNKVMISKKGKLVLCNLSENVKKVFAVMGYNAIIKVVATEEEAISFCK